MTKAAFSLFSPNTLRMKKILVKSGQKSAKKLTFDEMARDIFDSPLASTLERHLLVSEVLWNHDGRKVVFPGNTDFLNSLFKSKFELDDSATLNLPHASFIVAMPRDFEVKGVRIPSFIVNYCTADNRKDRYGLACKRMGFEEFDHSDANLVGSDSFSFFYQDPYAEEGVMVQACQSPQRIACALKAPSPEEYASIIGTMPHDVVSPFAMDISQSDWVIQFTITKIVSAMSIYMSANNITTLTAGVPSHGKLSISNLKTDIRYTFSHLPLPQSWNASSEDMTTRCFHFRQLRAPIYYQNEYKHLPPGSRWVFVNPAQVGKYKPEHIE